MRKKIEYKLAKQSKKDEIELVKLDEKTDQVKFEEVKVKTDH